jgi:hypothetical protein
MQRLTPKPRRSKGRNAEFYVISVTPVTEQPAEFRSGDEFDDE